MIMFKVYMQSNEIALEADRYMKRLKEQNYVWLDASCWLMTKYHYDIISHYLPKHEIKKYNLHPLV